jgi:integrase
MKAWREEQRVRVRLGAALPPPDSTFLEDVRTYLSRRQTMPTLADRKRDLARWVQVFGPERDRRTITSGEIATQLETWRKAGYAANTCNHRRTALMSLWSVLDGKTAPNPAKDAPKYRDESLDAPPRALSPIATALILERMRPSLTRARLELMLWTGWPHKQIKHLTPADIRWQDAVRLQFRRKGKGAAGVWLPLLPQAWAALEAFKKIGAWGTFRHSSVRTSFRRAARNVRETIMLPLPIWRELEDVTPYQQRHSFGTLVAALTQDDRAVQTLMQHSNITTTHRYTSATADPRAAAAVGMVAVILENSRRGVTSDP